jgi:hypothetical protein
MSGMRICAYCHGNGYIRAKGSGLPDVYLQCEVCLSGGTVKDDQSDEREAAVALMGSAVAHVSNSEW